MKRLSFPTGKPKNVQVLAAVAGGLVAVAVLGYLVLISPQRSRAADLNTKIDAAQQQLVTAEVASSIKPETPRVDDFFRLTKAMPDGPDMPSILLELSKVASDTGIQFDSFTPGSPVAGSGFQSVPIQLAFRGTYYQLSDFLFRLRNLVEKRDGHLDVGGRLYSVEGVDFSQAGTGKSTLSAQLTAKAYIYGQAAGTSATPAPVTPPATTTTTPGGTG